MKLSVLNLAPLRSGENFKDAIDAMVRLAQKTEQLGYERYWVAEHHMPVVVVVGIKEGCINHALLTVQSIIDKGLPLLGWVANRINPGLGHYAEVIETLKQKIDAPLLGEVSYVHKPEEQDLSRFITNVDRLTYMKTELVA